VGVEFVVSDRGTLHKLIGGRTFEGDNLDDARLQAVRVEAAERFLEGDGDAPAPVRIRRACRRCFPGVARVGARS
jgi:hypothetical protein